MPLGLGSSQWACILPKEATNLVANPSLEYGTSGWRPTTGGAAIGTSSAYQQFGAWSLEVNPTGASLGAIYGSASPTPLALSTGSAYTFSCYVRGSVGLTYALEVWPTAGGAALAGGSTVATGRWDQISFQYTESATNNRAIIVSARQTGDGTLFYVDGLQVELGSRTTYIDGDQLGGQWLGAPHASQSKRDGQYRGGGTVIALGDLGFRVDQMPGAGVPPVEVSVQSYAVVDGAQFQRQRAGARTLTLTAQPFLGTTLADFHVTRRTVWDALKPDVVTPQQPIRFLYVGGQGTSQIDAYYQSGMELGDMNGPMAEKAAVSFLATDPYFYSPTQQGTSLAPRTAIGSTNFIARRSPLGKWGTLGANGTTVAYNLGAPTLRTLYMNRGGTLFVGGNWGTVAGTIAPHIGMYYPATNTFGTLAGGTIENGADGVYTITENPSGTLFFGGQFTLVGGTTTFHVARWTGAFGTLQGGTVSGPSAAVVALLYSPLGTLILGGAFGTVGGTLNSNDIAFWTGAYGSLGAAGVGSTVGEGINTLEWGLDNRIFFGGVFTNVGGTIGTSIGFFKNGSFGTMGNATGVAAVQSLAVGPNGVLYEVGQFTGFNGGTTTNTAQWNGVQHSSMGLGLGNLNNMAKRVTVDQTTGNVYVGGAFSSIGSINTPSNYAVWNGYAWLLPDITISTPGTIWAITRMSDRSLYIGGDFRGTAQVASVGTMINSGRAQAYPVLRMRNLAAGTARIYQLLNTTTGNGIYFNLTLLGGEQATLNLTPGNRTFTSDTRGNLMSYILPGSNLATWSLLPGTNYVSFFSDNDSLEASFFWQPRGWSADSGTTY